MSLPDRRQWTRSTLATFQRRFAGFVSLAQDNVRNLGPHFEHDPFNATSGRKIATGRTPRWHRGHSCERDAHKFINQRIDIRLTDKFTAFLSKLELQHFSFGFDVLGIGLGPRRAPLWIAQPTDVAHPAIIQTEFAIGQPL